MTHLFLKTVNMSITASWLVLAIILLRFVLKKAPKWIHVSLWGYVGIRLLCPFTLESALSLIPAAEIINPNIITESTATVLSNGINNNAVVDSPQTWISILAVLWITGIFFMITYTAISYWKLRKRVSAAVRLQDNIYQCERISSPFVLGIIKARIYLPFQISTEDFSHVIAHEQAHIRRKDHWWKPLGFLFLALHWFNPIIWAAYLFLCRDIELACDEKVIKEMGREQRAEYSQALLTYSVSRTTISACPLAFGEVDVKERIKSVLHYKKPAFWIILISVAACIVVGICFLTNPKEKHSEHYKNQMLCVEIKERRDPLILSSPGGVFGESTWNYFDIETLEHVTLPGNHAVNFSIKEINSDCITITFDTTLFLHGQEVNQIQLEAGEELKLLTSTTGESTYYIFSINDRKNIDILEEP